MSTKNYTTNRFTPKYQIKKGDKVMVISGDNKGETGTVQQILTKENRAIVEGIKMVKKHSKPTENNPGGINEIESPVHISNLSLIDPKSGKATRVGRKTVDGKNVRYSKKSGEIIK
ncbi:MAG: 50S ribosomal protein L24 [Saprospiraceae bacterium]|nr:50S ribosomal protein L24 [Saprospiraceae bacterium]